MKKIINITLQTIFCILIFIMLLTSSIYILKNETIIPIITLIFTLIIITLLKKIKYKNKIKLKKNQIILLIVVAILIRISLLFLNYSNVFSDEATFYYNSIKLANNSSINTRYIAVFPYLYSYISLLSITMKLLGTKFITIVLLNIIIDLIGSYFIYLTGKTIQNKNLGLIMLLIWLYNPFQILWCTKALPVITVNTLFIISIYTYFTLIKEKNTNKKIILSIILGIILGISNSFRPIFIIFLIAIICNYIYNLIIKEKETNIKFINLILITIIFITCNKIYTNIVSHQTNYKIGNNTSGWTLYLGSNIESSGTWLEVPEFNKFLNSKENEFDVVKIHNYFKHQAINNYKKYNGLELATLYAKKYYILTSNVPTYTYENTIKSLTNNKIIVAYKIYLIVFYFIILLNSITIKLKNNKNTQTIFLIIIEIGLIMSHLLVEVSPRYFIPLTIPLLLISILQKSKNYTTLLK